jgi:hypothetical protein
MEYRVAVKLQVQEQNEQAAERRRRSGELVDACVMA